MEDLEKIRAIFLTSDMDAEDYEDNLKRIEEWEESIRSNEDFASWQESDVTKAIALQAKQTYRDNAMLLILKRDLTDAERQSIWSRQDAAIWLLSMIEKDAKGMLKQIHTEIKKYLKVE